MILKKFQAPTETEAVLKAKEELGSSAVIMNVKTLKQRGIFRLFRKDMVEVTAALEENDFAESIRTRKKPAVQTNTAPAATGNGFSAAADEKIDLKDSEAIEKKLDSLQNMLKDKMLQDTKEEKSTEHIYKEVTEKFGVDGTEAKEEKKEENSNFKFLQLFYNKIIENDVDEKFANQIIGEIENSIKKESNMDSLLSTVYQKIILKLGEPKVIELDEKKPKIVFFLGPTGVGKTTTIAKLASLFKIEKNSRVAFVTADTYRIAAVEQLNTYASIIDCPVHVVYSYDEIEEIIESLKNFDLILVDTAGRSHRSEEQMLEIVDLYEHVQKHSDKFDIEAYLTLSVTTKYKDLIHIADSYKDIPNYRMIFTKLDETCSLGNILNMRMYTGAPLSYTTSGQNVPNDIEVVNEQELAKQLLGGRV